MASTEEVIQRLKESRPPATDPFTYLTIIEKSLSPEILPTLEEILEDGELTNDIGWDMVEMLISVPESENCLELIARLGNPREVILKVLEVMEKTSEESEAGAEGSSKKFITLLRMLTILHRRLQVKAPSRFLQPTLHTVYQAYYSQGAETTAAVIDLVRSLTPQKRPPLPTRQSSTKLDAPFRESDMSKSAPDPEADQSGQLSPGEGDLVNRLLQSFITCIIEAYVNTNSMEWSARLLEYCEPERVVPRRKSTMQAFKEVEELQARDALVGQLVTIAGDLGLSTGSSAKVKELFGAPFTKNPLAVEPDSQHPENTKVTTSGFLCFAAYRMFASDLFDADYHQPDINIFPDHHSLLKKFLGDEPQAQIMGNPGTTDALVAMGLYLEDQKLIGKVDDKANFMSYHHLLTLISVFHPSISTRNAATRLAGSILHSDPDEDDRLNILEDLLENCMFSSLQACAVTWLREEMIAARKAGSAGRFASSSCLDTLQYTLFQDLTHLNPDDTAAFHEFWEQSAPLHLQVANFALFLFGGKDFRDLAPAGMAAAVEHRYFVPLLASANKLQQAVEKKEIDVGEAGGGELVMNLSILIDTLERVPLQ